MSNLNKTEQEIRTVTLTLTIEELDLIRHATWSLESEISKDIVDANKLLVKNDGSYWVRRIDIQKDMYFDSKALRSKVVEANSEAFNDFEDRQAFEKEHELKAGDMCSRYVNNS